jgi:hypothetical protein
MIIKPEFEYTGWELSPDCLITIQELLIEKARGPLLSSRGFVMDIVEFGSGKSTQVLLDFIRINGIAGYFESFDADPTFAHPKAKIREIISYDGRPISFGNDYAFYNLRQDDLLSDSYNLVVLDGHHGHGRSVAWKYLENKLDIGCLVVIDDYDHYPFVEDFQKIFPNSRYVTGKTTEKERWVIYEIISK